MSDRFFVEFPIAGDSAVLSGQEAVHLSRVLRARIGDLVLLFDGSGAEFKARVECIKKDSVECAILERRQSHRELSRFISMGVALPKGDRQRFLVEKLTELGVASLTPLISERSVVQPDEQSVIRLKRFAIEASKQCGRNQLMAIQSPSKFDHFIASTDPDAVRVIAHPLNCAQVSAAKFWSSAEMCQALGNKVVFVVGPEGGFTDDEMARACDQGFLPVDLGPRTLRTETAAIALASIAGLTHEMLPGRNRDG